VAVAQPVCTIVRHGQTEWSRSGQHTSRTELELTPEGEREARLVGEALRDTPFDEVWCSPRQRARCTAELAGLTPFTVVDDLQEWDYGELEGLTTVQIRERFPDWSIWDGPWPGGEPAAEVAARADRLIRGVMAAGVARLALVGHGHFSRVLAARWVGEPVAAGRWLDLDTATWSELGWAREARVVRRWNVPASP
jgi:broad specificity phosphatase PhoE